MIEIIQTQVEAVSPDKKHWHVFGASAAGKGHRDESGKIATPCQDSHKCSVLDNNWVAIVICDGAGSYSNSKMGSEYCVEHIIDQLKASLPTKDWYLQTTAPTKEEWRLLAIQCFTSAFDGLKTLAVEKGIDDYHTLGCTVNAALFCDAFILSAHIGDGRAAYSNGNSEWSPTIIPFKGDQVGSTVFITSDYCWKEPDICIETRVTEDQINCVAVLTDGLENYCYQHYTTDENGRFYDPNKPFPAFFDTNINTLKQLLSDDPEMVSSKWENYIENGYAIANEYDDKTMVLAFKM